MASFLSIQQITRLFFAATLALTMSFAFGCDDESTPADNNETNEETDPTGEEVAEYFRANIGGIPWSAPEMEYGPSVLTEGEYLLSGFNGFARSLNFFLEGNQLGEYIVDPGIENLTTYLDLAQNISIAALSGSIILVEAPEGYVKGTFDVTMQGNLHITGEFLVEKDE